MKLIFKKFAGQSLISWIFQLALIWVAWQVASKSMPNNLTTIFIAAGLLLAIYISFSLDKKYNQSESK
ncbi:hypothetical protein PL11_004890 [Lentilactobacillus curieae]|uniref:Uncharacterized protein n=1 Tax=Lentilactobacillus curieae TaxID=1138822 RepID=A0A1S6QI75_9LACO|nr:hypothetical protein [Lentilactobacillus curieae]AQW21308.1 hypothetical protein PL11_004890 [Lentilactobacillus curieae]